MTVNATTEIIETTETKEAPTNTSKPKRKTTKKAASKKKVPTAKGAKKKAGTKKRSKKATTQSAMTIAELAEGYLTNLEVIGKGRGTVFSYSIELKAAMRTLGTDTKVCKLTTKKVKEYFDSDQVTKTRSGTPKAKPTVDKTRRVLRLALVWAEEQGIIEKAPIPEGYGKRSKKG